MEYFNKSLYRVSVSLDLDGCGFNSGFDVVVSDKIGIVKNVNLFNVKKCHYKASRFLRRTL